MFTNLVQIIKNLTATSTKPREYEQKIQLMFTSKVCFYIKKIFNSLDQMIHTTDRNENFQAKNHPIHALKKNILLRQEIPRRNNKKKRKYCNITYQGKKWKLLLKIKNSILARHTQIHTKIFSTPMHRKCQEKVYKKKIEIPHISRKKNLINLI